MSRRPYVRTMAGWWRRDPFFVRYMIRESTAVLVAAYAVVLLVGLVRLVQGEAAYDGWLQALRSPASILVHVLALAAFVYHTWSWFDIMPKTMPLIFFRGRRLPAGIITGAGVAASVASCLALLLFALRVSP